MKDTKQSVMRSGNLNPMYGKKQSRETKQKISNTQKERYAAIRKALKEQDIILEYAATNDKARKDVLKQLLDRNNLDFNNVQQAVNFLGIMLQKDRIKEIINMEINNFINECNNVGYV